MVGESPTHDDDVSAPARPVLTNYCPHPWTWDVDNRSPDAVVVHSSDRRTVLFHPSWSNGTAGIRGTKPLDRDGVYYWEVLVSRRLFGTSLMFGVASPSARLHADAFINLLGEDEFSWALSHKGTLWHRGRCRQYTSAFSEHDSTTVGLLFDGPRATLTYFKDGVCLGQAFTGVDTRLTLYPAICSTAAKTEMTLVASVRSFSSLQDRCRAVVARHLVNPGRTDVDVLPLPQSLKQFVGEVVDVGCQSSSRPTDLSHGQPRPRRRALKFWPPSDVNYWPRAAWLHDCIRH